MPSSRYFASCWVRVRRPLAVAEAEIVKPSRTAQWPCPFWARPRLFAENWPNKRGAACPNGSAEEDWIEAERRLRANSRQGKTADVSWGDDRVKSAVTRKFPQV